MGDGVRKRLSYMNAAEVMDKVFDIYKRSFFPQIGMNLCVYTIGAVILYILLVILALAGAAAGGIIGGMSPGGLSAPAIAALCGAGAAVFLWLFLIYSNTAASATGLLSWLSFSGKPVNISYALKNTMKSFWRITTLSLAETIAGIPIILFAVLAVYAVFNSQGMFSRDYWVYGYFLSWFNPFNLFLLSAIILLFTLLIYIIYNYFALALPVAVFDRKHFFPALAGSYRLMKKHFWRILGVRFAFFGARTLLGYSFTGITSVLIGALTGISNSLSPNQGGVMILAITVQYIVSIISTILMMPLNSIFTSVIFFNQKIKKEGLDLAMQLELLER